MHFLIQIHLYRWKIDFLIFFLIFIFIFFVFVNDHLSYNGKTLMIAPTMPLPHVFVLHICACHRVGGLLLSLLLLPVIIIILTRFMHFIECITQHPSWILCWYHKHWCIHISGSKTMLKVSFWNKCFRMGNQWDHPKIPQLQMIQFLSQQNHLLELLQMSLIKEMVEMLQWWTGKVNNLLLREKDEGGRKVSSKEEERESGLCLRVEDLLHLAGLGLGLMWMVEHRSTSPDSLLEP